MLQQIGFYLLYKTFEIVHRKSFRNWRKIAFTTERKMSTKPMVFRS